MNCGPSSAVFRLLAREGTCCAIVDPVDGEGSEEGQLRAWRFSSCSLLGDGVDGELAAGFGDGDVGGVEVDADEAEAF
jgi:hypothetical protein